MMRFSRKIIISDLIIECSIGILEQEMQHKQSISIEANIKLDSSFTTLDNIEQVLDYRNIVEIITREVTSQHFGLIETLSYRISNNLLNAFSEIISIKMKISKFGIFENCKSISIEEEYQR